MQNFLLFCKKKLTFSILHSYFTKHSHQFIYSTHLFNKIFISLTLFIYSQNPLISASAWALSPTDQPHQSTILTPINPNRKSISHQYSSTFANTAINESQWNFQNPPKPYSTTSLPPPTKKTPSPSSLSLRNSNSLPIHELLLLSPSPHRKFKTRLIDQLEMAEELVEPNGSRRRYKSRAAQTSLPPPKNPNEPNLSQTLVTDEGEEKQKRSEKMIERYSVCLEEREKYN